MAKTIEILIASERLADQILANKAELVELDKQRQSLREALSQLKHIDGSAKVWTTVGVMMVKLERSLAEELLKKDQSVNETSMQKLREEQRDLVNKLRDVERSAPIKGFDLKPLHSAEINAICSKLGRK